MKVVIIYAAMTGYEHGLNVALRIVGNTFSELNVEVENVNLAYMDIHYFDGYKTQAVVNLFENCRNADGIIFMMSAQRMAPSAIMQILIEHFDDEVYGNVLEGKCCMSVATSKDGSENEAISYMNRIINMQGGIEVCRMPIGRAFVEDINKNAEVKEMIERYAEDFYRMLRQNRKFFINKPISVPNISGEKYERNTNRERYQKAKEENYERPKEQYQKPIEENYERPKEQYQKPIEEDYERPKKKYNKPLDKEYQYGEEEDKYQYQKKNEKKYESEYSQRYGANIDNNEMETLLGKTEKRKVKAEEYMNNLNLEQFNERQERDVEDLAKMLSKQENKESNPTRQAKISDLYKSNSMFSNENVVPHKKSCKQKTQSLYHYFQPQFAKDMNAIIQINVKGNERFEGYIIISDGECNYIDGVYEEPNMTMFVDCDVWEDILDGKYSTQKAFMIGKLKVRGNFILLSKLDKIFKMD